MAHDKFQTVEAEINWNAPMFKLYEKAKQNPWDPADLDFTQDKKDFDNMNDDEKATSLPLVSYFSAGEEAVTIDILPMVHLMARQGRLEDTMFLTTFMFDEAKHTEMFSRWQREMEIGDMDLSVFHNDNYKRIFYEQLPEKMERLSVDDSPEAIIKAATVYNMIVEGTLAKTGYYSFREIFRKRGLLPGILQGIDYLNQDEGRHLQFGIYTIQRHVVGNEKNMRIFDDYMDELWPDAYGAIDYLTTMYDIQMEQDWTQSNLHFDSDLMREYAKKQFEIRKKQVHRAEKFNSVEELDKNLVKADEV
ncbi:MAG TPA: R2-like ligand-binding oxidase [Bacillota bacterium]|nr:R2-like ligand-binding oxidase [Bacillota bacterium]